MNGQNWLTSELGPVVDDPASDPHNWMTSACCGSAFSEEDEQGHADAEARTSLIRLACDRAGRGSESDRFIESGLSVQQVIRELIRDHQRLSQSVS